MTDAFRSEIIEAENNRVDLLKWKLIIAASLGAVALGIGSPVTHTGTPLHPILVLALIPLASTYVDLLCLHLQLRILVISVFFQGLNRNMPSNVSLFASYEQYCERVRPVFNFEDHAQIFSTFLLSVFVAIAAVIIFPNSPLGAERVVLMLSGVLGLLSSLVMSIALRRKLGILRNE